MRHLSSFVAVAALATVVAAPASAQTDFFAVINGAQERPTPVNTPGGGIGFLTIVNATTINVNLSISNLLFPIQNGVDGHIHISSTGPENNGPVFVALFGNPGFTGTITGGPGSTFATINGTFTGSTGTQNVAAVVTALQDGNAQTVPYFNFHTTQFPAGEVRGNLSLNAPEPGSVALFGLGVLGAVVIRRRVRK